MPLRQGNNRGMAMNRRDFLLLATTAMLTPPLWIGRRKAARGCVEAERPRRYAGPVKKIDTAVLGKPGRWAG